MKGRKSNWDTKYKTTALSLVWTSLNKQVRSNSCLRIDSKLAQLSSIASAASRLQSTPATPVEYTNKAADVSYARDMTNMSAKRLAADKHVRAPAVSLGEKILSQYCRLNLKSPHLGVLFGIR